MANQNPTANGRDRFSDEPFDERDKSQDCGDCDNDVVNKEREPMKGRDIDAPTNAEDLDKAKRTTM